MDGILVNSVNLVKVTGVRCKVTAVVVTGRCGQTVALKLVIPAFAGIQYTALG